jgi:putative DNA methylase
MTYKKKLIEVAMPLAVINRESAREKSIRHGHPSTLHLWWARRPLAAARAVLWASLVDDPSAHPDRFPTEQDQLIERKRLFDILERLVPWEATNDQRVLAEARAEINRSCEGVPPRILDPFAGGGSIPLEAVRLGLKTFAGDLNPVAVMVERGMLEVPQRFTGRSPVNSGFDRQIGAWEGAHGLVADIEEYGRRIGRMVQDEVGQMYVPAGGVSRHGAETIAWFWARAVQSPDPSWNGAVPLVGSWVIVNKPGKPVIWVDPVVAHETIVYHVREGGVPGPGTISRGNGTCIATGTAIPNEYIKKEGMAGRLSQQLIALVVQGDRTREYLSPTAVDVEAARVDDAECWRPVGAMSTHSQYMGTPRYGLDEWWKLFTPRQRVVIDAFCRALDAVRPQIMDDALRAGMKGGSTLNAGGDGALAYSQAVTMYLAFVLDRAISRWNTLSIWDPSRESLAHVFRMQTVQMTWTFAEANPFSDYTGGWPGQIDWVTEALLHLPTSTTGETAQRDAQARIAEVDNFVLSTDPPYYDNVPYSDISDFFYVWMRRTLGATWPDECATILTPKAEELVADQYRFGGRQAAKEHFERGMKSVFRAAVARADERYPATIFYAFKAAEESKDGHTSTGWETFLEGILDAGLAITATWPIRTEMSGGVRNAGRNSLASSVVLACRPRVLSAPLATRGEFVGALRAELAPAVRLLQIQNIAPVDLAQSAIGPGIAIFSRYAKVIEADGKAMRVRTALGLINEVLAEVLSGEESEFDADTRFALTWFEQFGHNPGPFGDADLLARAKDTTVGGVAEAGVVVSRDGKVRLVERSELPSNWDPAKDERLTVWEAAQHLIRAVELSEIEAAALLTRLGGGLGDRARQLAYLLYGICDRKKWADEAGAYNMLVTAWPEISKLAAAASGSDTQETLF